MSLLSAATAPLYLTVSTAPLPSTLLVTAQTAETISGIVLATGSPPAIAQASGSLHSTASPSTSTTDSPSSMSAQTLPTGAVIGVALAAAAVSFILVFTIFLCIRQRRNSQASHSFTYQRSLMSTSISEIEQSKQSITRISSLTYPTQEHFVHPFGAVAQGNKYKHMSKDLPRSPTPPPSMLGDLNIPLGVYQSAGMNRYGDEEIAWCSRGPAPTYEESVYSSIRASGMTDQDMTWSGGRVQSGIETGR